MGRAGNGNKARDEDKNNEEAEILETRRGGEAERGGAGVLRGLGRGG